MTPGLTFFLGLLLLILFGWYFATDYGLRKRLLATLLAAMLVAFSIATIWPPEKQIALGLDIRGGTSFLIKLQQLDKDKPITPGLLDQAVEVIRKRVDYFGGGEPIISPVGQDRILVQIPGLDTAKIQEARAQLSRVAKLEFRLVYPDDGQRLKAIDNGTEVVPPEYKIENHKHVTDDKEKATTERLLVKKKADLGGDRVSSSNAIYGNEGWTVQLKFDNEGAKKFGQITEQFKGHRFAIALDGVILSAPVIRDAIYGGDAIIPGQFTETEAPGLSSAVENPLQTAFKVAVQAAYEKAFSSIFDANVTTLITAVILFWKASGPVKGFAISLTLGILASLFTALIVGRNIFEFFVDTGRVKKISMMHLISSQNINFLGKGFLACMCSLALVCAGATSFYLRGEKNFGVDFRGGDLITLSSPQAIDVGKVRAALQPINLADATIQESNQGGKYYITVRTPLHTSDAVEKQIMTAMPEAQFKVEGAERVGALVGGELARSSLVALGLGILGILIFVTLRFELSFAVGAIVALLHDVLITVGMFSLLHRELTLTMVGAVLTIAGYSINDTIVVYDRIREGLASGRKGSIEQIMNESINQTLSRTILTSTVTLIPILCLFLFGGAVLRDFSLAIIIGVVVGTYSSIFIASPIVLWWTRARGGSKTSLQREITSKQTKPATAA